MHEKCENSIDSPALWLCGPSHMGLPHHLFLQMIIAGIVLIILRLGLMILPPPPPASQPAYSRSPLRDQDPNTVHPLVVREGPGVRYKPAEGAFMQPKLPKSPPEKHCNEGWTQRLRKAISCFLGALHSKKIPSSNCAIALFSVSTLAALRSTRWSPTYICGWGYNVTCHSATPRHCKCILFEHPLVPTQSTVCACTETRHTVSQNHM